MLTPTNFRLSPIFTMIAKVLQYFVPAMDRYHCRDDNFTSPFIYLGFRRGKQSI